MRKAQIFTTDFIISLAVFLAILTTIITLWSGVDLHIKEVESRREMHSIALSVSDALVRSKGYPYDWNQTNVQSIGLAKEEYVVDMRKVISMMSMDYDTVRSILRLGNYHFYLYMTDINGYNVSTGIIRSPVGYMHRFQTERFVAYELNDSGLVWDLYQGGGADESSLFNERYYYYPGPGKSAEDLFNIMIDNHTSYRTIIAEETNLKVTDINVTGLQEFLNNGGVFLEISQGNQGYLIIEKNFSMHSVKLAPTNGVVRMLDSILVNVSVGDIVAFDDSSWRFYQEPGDLHLNIYVSEQSDPDMCLTCMWEYGKGRVYYVQYFAGEINPPSGQRLEDSLNFIGWPVRYGVPPTNTTMDVIALNRIAILEGVFRQPVSMHIIIWR